MARPKTLVAAALIAASLASCVSYNAYEKARSAEERKDWDNAVVQYEKALEVDPGNTRYRMSLDRAKLEASRAHFERGKSLKAAADNSASGERIRLATLAAGELQLTVKLDPTNQYAAVELAKSVRMVQDTQAALNADATKLEQMKKKASITKAQPPDLNPASDEPISLSFPRPTPVKDIYRALGNAFGINVLFDQAVKDDQISIELKDVTAQQALERVMQAANHFYKVLDEHTIIVIPDNPQARRDYEDLVIRTFYLSNGDAEQVTNVVRTMIEARNVFPLKALNAITIRDTADKVRIAEKIIQANDKAKSEVVVDVELLQLDLNKVRNIGANVAGLSGTLQAVQPNTNTAGVISNIPISSTTLEGLRSLTSNNFMFAMPSIEYSLVKSVGNAELLANPELRISEGEKATLHIGQRIPVPVSTFTSVATGTTGGTYAPVTSFQYQDVGIKVSMEPRVHHNREVTLKLTVEVSNQGTPVKTAGQPDQPTFATRTIESTIRLKDGETNFLAGLIQDVKREGNAQTPFLSDIPIIGRLFTNQSQSEDRTDLILTMTPHIIRIPDITDDDMAPMWVGTQNNLTFRGVSPRIESQTGGDPFTPASSSNPAFRGAAPGGMSLTPVGGQDLVNPQGTPIVVPQGSGPTNTFNPGNVTPAPPKPKRPASSPETSLQPSPDAPQVATAAADSASATSDGTDRHALIAAVAEPYLSPRLAPQPALLSMKPGEEKLWNVIGMDLDGLTANELLLHFDPRAIDVSQVMLGEAFAVDSATPPSVTINRDNGLIRVRSTDGKPLRFNGGGNVLALRVRGGMTGETFLVLENPGFHTAAGEAVRANIGDGHANVN